MLFDKQNAKLHALHRVLTRIRTEAYLGLPSNEMGRLLDDAEYLTTLLFHENQENDEIFGQMLAQIERRYTGFEGLMKCYSGMEVQGTGRVQLNKVG